MKTKVFIYDQLHPIVQEFREIRADEHETRLTHFVPPMGYPEIVFYIGPQNQVKNTTAYMGFIKGQYNSLQKIDLCSGYHFFTVVLHPYGLKQLLNIRADELRNAVLDVAEHPLTLALAKLLQHRAVVSTELIAEMDSLMRQYAWQPISGATTTFIELVKRHPEAKVQELIKDKGINIRTLQRNFKQEVGLSPKEFVKIKRMNAIERRLAKDFEPLQIVADFDFADQSHFIRECKQLRTFTPGELVSKKMLLASQLPTPEYIHIDNTGGA